MSLTPRRSPTLPPAAAHIVWTRPTSPPGPDGSIAIAQRRYIAGDIEVDELEDLIARSLTGELSLTRPAGPAPLSVR